MKAAALKYTFLSAAANLSALIIALIPFHAFLTVWLSTAVGHYTALRLWKEVLLGLVTILVIYLVLTDKKIRTHTLTRRLVWVILTYISLLAADGIFAFINHQVNAKALGYGLLSDCRYLLFFLFTWVISLRTSKLQTKWRLLLFVPFLIVASFGLIQELFLSPRFLEHFGYSKYTILPFQYVDNQTNFLRVQSTLRGANPLGAYLIIGLTALVVELTVLRKLTLKPRIIILLGIGLVTLFFTYSRSAWLGLIASLFIIVLTKIKDINKKIIYSGISLLVLFTIGLSFAIFYNSNVQNALLHTSESSKSPVSSNSQRAKHIVDGVKDVIQDPLGEGVGTAGPASAYNAPAQARIAENYFLQIGQEVGILGMSLFIVINAGVGYLLWLRRSDPLALTLFASLIGLTIVNLLSHAWADDTLAYIWWGLAGIAMSIVPTKIIAAKDDPA